MSFLGTVAKMIEAALGAAELRADQLPPQIPGGQIAPGSPGTPGAVDPADFEPALGEPAADGYLLSSSAAGVRLWLPLASVIHAAAAKAAPADADELGLIDSAASYGLRRLTWASVKAALKGFFDGLYAGLAHKSRHAAGGGDALSPADIGALPLTGGTLSGALRIDLAAAPAAALGTSNNIALTGTDSAVGATFAAAGAGGGTRPLFFFVRARGSIGAPTAVASGDLIATLTGAGYDGTTTQATAYIAYVVDGAVSAGVVPQALILYTGPTDAASRVARLKIASGGAVLIGRTSGLAGAGDLDVAGRVRGDTIETAAGSQWKLAGHTADATDRASNGYVTVTIGGASYKLMTRA